MLKEKLLGGDNDDVKEDKRLEAVGAKHSMLQGYEGLWIKLRRNDCTYVLNKIASMSIAFIFAIITIVFKPTTMAFQVQCKAQTECSAGFGGANHYLLIYWLLFIYLCLQMLDEMIELFSVMNQLEKGALGLFFEMNYLVGVILSIYITWFIFSYNPPQLPPLDELEDQANATKYR
jgi:hypothetical protein